MTAKQPKKKKSTAADRKAASKHHKQNTHTKETETGRNLQCVFAVVLEARARDGGAPHVIGEADAGFLVANLNKQKEEKNEGK